jgi:hypothetical protein
MEELLEGDSQKAARSVGAQRSERFDGQVCAKGAFPACRSNNGSFTVVLRCSMKNKTRKESNGTWGHYDLTIVSCGDDYHKPLYQGALLIVLAVQLLHLGFESTYIVLHLR